MSLIELTENDKVAIVELARADQRNALNLQMFEDLVNIGESLVGRTDLSAVILRGQGPDFCAGIDTSMVKSPDQLETVMHALLSPLDGQVANLVQRSTLVWRDVPAPVIAQLQGNVFGAGFQLAMACDFRIAAEDTRMSIMEGRWGLIPDMGLTQNAANIADDVLRELTYTAKIIDANQAHQYGLLTHVLASPEIYINDLIKQLQQRSMAAVQAAKKLFNDAPALSIENALALEQSLQMGLMKRMIQQSSK